MIELHERTPRLLEKGNYVRFLSPEENFSPTFKANVIYQVKSNVQVVFYTAFIIPPGDVSLVKLNNDEDALGLYPENPKTLYEVLVGFGGTEDIIIYPMMPSTDYLLYLEKAGMRPNPGLPQLRYLGMYTTSDSPVNNPRLVLYFVKDMDQFALQLYNTNTKEDEKLIVRFVINKCYLEEVREEVKAPVKDILHYKLLRW